MIKLSDMLIATLDDKDPLIALQIAEVKRLEALDVPRNESQRKPLVDEDGDEHFFVVDDQGIARDEVYGRSAAELSAEFFTKKNAQPHTVCQVMAPESGKCPTIPVATYTPTPEKPHEWAIYLDRFHSMIHPDGQSTNMLYLAKRFATTADAQAYIDENDIADAYPWAVPKLTSSQ